MRTYEKERARQRNDHQLKKAEKERKRKEEERRKVEQWRRREDEKRRKDKEAENMRRIQQKRDRQWITAQYTQTKTNGRRRPPASAAGSNSTVRAGWGYVGCEFH